MYIWQLIEGIIVQKFTTEFVSEEVSNLRSDSVSTVQEGQAP